MAIEKGDLVAAMVKPGELAARVHQPQQELPDLKPLTRKLDRDLEEVALRLVAGPMDQRHIARGALPAQFA